MLDALSQELLDSGGSTGPGAVRALLLQAKAEPSTPRWRALKPSAGDRQHDAFARAGVDLVVRVGDAVKR
jgi:hypothetical protein